MSRIGKQPVPIPKGVVIEQNDDFLIVKGPKGELRRKIHPKVKVNRDNDHLVVSVNEETRVADSLYGLHRALIGTPVADVENPIEPSRVVRSFDP